MAAIYPVVLYRDPDAAAEWLGSALGMTVSEIHRDDEGAVVHGELMIEDSVVMIATAEAGREPFRSVPAGTALTYIAVEDPDALYRRAVAAGAEIPLEPVDTDYGSRDFTLRDLEGNLWSFGTYRPPSAAS